MQTVEVALDIGLQNPVHLAVIDRCLQRPKSIVRATPRTKPERARQEILLVDRFENVADPLTCDLPRCGRLF